MTGYETKVKSSTKPAGFLGVRAILVKVKYVHIVKVSTHEDVKNYASQ